MAKRQINTDPQPQPESEGDEDSGLNTAAPSQQGNKDILNALKTAISTASPEEKASIAKELGVGRSIGKSTQRRRTQRQTNEQVQAMSHASFGASHPPDFVPVPPDWVVEHGGGMNMHEVELLDKDGKTVKEMSPRPGEDAFVGNWAVDIYRDRWANNLAPLPSTMAYNAERESQGGFDSSLDGQTMANADQYAGAASE